jgi:hypothetical protein
MREEEEVTTQRHAMRSAAIVPRLVAIAITVLTAPPLVYFASIMGGDLGLRAARSVVAVHNETYPFIFGSVLGVTVAVLAVGLLATVTARAASACLKKRD